jgi:uncharacterized protein
MPFEPPMQFAGVDWDAGSREKCQKHGVPIAAIETLFTRRVALLPDHRHSDRETRYRAIGWDNDGRAVFIVFTMRRRGGDALIRPISARTMHKKEIERYEKENPGLQE